MTASTWLNGKACDNIAINDRGLAYGDGLFTTMLVEKGQCCLFERHLARLQNGIKQLAMSQIDFGQLIEQLTSLANEIEHGVIKVIITRGQGVRGYSSLGCDTPSVIVSHSAYPTSYDDYIKHGLNLGVSTIALGLNPLTAGIKHLNRLEQVLVRQQIDQEQWADAVVLDCQGYVVETNMANLFWVSDGTVKLPALDFAGVDGVMRQHILAYLKQQQIPYEIDRFRLGSLVSAEEIFISNSLIKVVPITAIAEHAYSIGPITQQLQRNLV
ncbi:aminodeoxychorismate lyase [Psychrobium sp. 1_MG-2023]|uniref:aminodeoxychorismate lyase n=1 Tax=Psychrobium sp. 1_MG-2023 TaxID=3062624 RepID=UPI000C335BD6|nr:aminodeoxychorismate lyase [Psychrobium sp. 1_MG-2023]MDP2561682.1 aminodeoxychorismate lyase [Psychrobium sp. 1_MG-2023]PKF57086.1 aminodeoxychorismate lyase [Alteromonadales bacterium alter-6D02]